MKKEIIAINGESWCRNLTGIERLAIEVTKYLDDLVKPGQMELVVPRNAKNLPELKNIKTVILDTDASFFPKWTQVDFQKYVIHNHRTPLDYSNCCPFFKPGYEFIHDLYCKLYKDDMSNSRRDRIVRLYSNIMYRTIARKAKKVFTVSEYTKKTIIDTYGTKADKISVVYSGVSGYEEIKPDFSVFQKLSIPEGKEFYFSLGSLSIRKNLKWIADHAELYPDELFVISGKALSGLVPEELKKIQNLKNVIMPGYLSDEEVKAILSRCRAFILPSYFEGFGLPPLEALSCGTKVIISNATCLPEIYGKCAYYIDPDEPDVNLNELLENEVAPPSSILEKYTLKNTAMRIYNEISSNLPFVD